MQFKTVQEHVICAFGAKLARINDYIETFTKLHCLGGSCKKIYTMKIQKFIYKIFFAMLQKPRESKNKNILTDIKIN